MFNFKICGVQKVLVISPHPDDAELAMGGMIAAMLEAGCEVHLADLTNGEPTPFGNADIREVERQQASVFLRLNHRYCLDMPNRYLENTLENRKKLAILIREVKPQIIFSPISPDEHPDHVAAYELTHGARFQAKLHKTDMPGDPHWTPTVIAYYSTHMKLYESPSIIFDISNYWTIKSKAISSYKSQLRNKLPDGSSLLEKVEAVNRYFGQSINCEYAEPFKLFEPLVTKL